MVVEKTVQLTKMFQLLIGMVSTKKKNEKLVFLYVSIPYRYGIYISYVVDVKRGTNIVSIPYRYGIY